LSEGSRIKNQITQDLLTAMKSRDEFAVRVLRSAKTALDAAEKDKKSELDDNEVIKVLKKRIKQSEDARQQAAAGGRDDLAGTEGKEIEFLKKYLPAEMSEAEVTAAVEEVVSELGGEVTQKDFGRVMGAAMKKLGGNVDGNLVKKIVQEKLK